MPISKGNRLYLEKYHLTEYKSIEDLTVDFKKDLNILIGKNGAGKSNLLQAIFETLRSRHSLHRRFPFKTVTADFITSANDNAHLEIVKLKRAGIKGNDEEYEGHEFSQVLVLNGSIAYNNLPDISTSQEKLSTTLRFAFNRIKVRYGSPVYIRYSIPNDIECISSPGEIRIPLEEPDMLDIPYGISLVYRCFENFESSVINGEMEPSEIDKRYLLDSILADDIFLNNLRKFSPIKGFKLNENINIYNDDKQLIIENLKFDFYVDDKWMPWSYLSDGTKRLFYLIAEVSVSDGRLILIEEPELGVHPHQFNLLMHFLKEQSQYSQIIMSTHSPAALDHLDQDELDRVLIAYASENGTKIKRIAPDQRSTAIKYMNEVGSLSDYWIMSDLEE